MYKVAVILKEWNHCRNRWKGQWSRIGDQEAYKYFNMLVII